MSSIAIALAVFGCVFGGALLGMWLHGVLPDHHLNADSKDVVKLAMGLVATMAALVLGLLTSSAKSAFDTVDNEVKEAAASVIMLDRTLGRYGPETKDSRDLIRGAVAARIEAIWPEDIARPGMAEADAATPPIEILEGQMRALTPQNDVQRSLQTRALDLTGQLLQTRWLVFGSAGNTIQALLVIVLVFWLAALFTSFGLLAPRNATVVVVLLVAAMSVAGSMFLILEMNRPLEGVVKISSAPLRFALSQLGH